MAVTFESIQATDYVTTTDLVITKPVDVAVGDLLIGFVQGDNAAWTWPAGWDTVKALIDASGNSVMIVYSRIATSADVSASNYTVTSVAANLAGCIMRITGHHSTPVAVFAFDNDSGTATPTFTSSVTPTNPDSLILFFLGTYLSSSTGRTASGYAVATSNPSWTERADQDIGTGSSTLQMAVATASRPEVTATGNASVTLSGLCTELSNIMVVVRPKISITVSETPSVSDTINKGIGKVFLETPSVNDTLTSTKQKDWDNESKNSSVWINENKN